VSCVKSLHVESDGIRLYAVEQGQAFCAGCFDATA